MKSFIIKLLLFFICECIIVYILSIDIIPDKYRSNYIHAVYDKQKLLDKRNHARILFSGGSATAWGLDSKKIINDLGYDVINLGLHGGLSPKFYINQLEYNIREDDYICLSFEYDQSLETEQYLVKFINDLPYIEKSILDLIKIRLDNIDNNYSYLLLPLPTINKNRMLSRENFNKHGDFIGHLKGLSHPINYKNLDRTYDIYPLIYNKIISDLNEFYENALLNGSTVYYIYPSIPISFYAIIKENLLEEISLFEKNISIPILGSIENFIYPDSLFYEGKYHLNNKGRSIRTKHIIDLLDKRIKK